MVFKLLNLREMLILQTRKSLQLYDFRNIIPKNSCNSCPSIDCFILIRRNMSAKIMSDCLQRSAKRERSCFFSTEALLIFWYALVFIILSLTLQVKSGAHALYSAISSCL